MPVFCRRLERKGLLYGKMSKTVKSDALLQMEMFRKKAERGMKIEMSESGYLSCPSGSLF